MTLPSQSTPGPDHAAPRTKGSTAVYMKAVAQIVATVIAAIIPALAGDNHIDSSEWINVGILALGAVAVVGAGEFPAGVWRWMKTYVSAGSAALVFVASIIGDGITTAEWWQLAIAVLGALGVTAVPGPKVFDAAALGRAASGLSNGPA